MAEITLAEALDTIEGGSTVKERNRGLSDLNYILRHNQQGTLSKKLDNASWHLIFDSLFRIALKERTAFVKATTATTRTTSANRLSEIASALRQSVTAGVQLLSNSKTIKAVIDHVTETIYLSAGGFCEPVALDYAKCLHAIFSYQPHVEHLADGWDRMIDFCLDCLDRVETETADDYGNVDIGSTMTTTNGLSYRSSRSTNRDPSGSQASRSSVKPVADEMIACLQLLSAAPTAPLKQKASHILWKLIEFLKTSGPTSSANQDAFATVNHVLSWSRTEDVSLTQQATGHVIRLVRNLWDPKSFAMNQMLITLLLVQPYISHAMRQSTWQVLRADLVGLSRAITAEYNKRPEREQLSMDDFRLEVNTRVSRRDSELSTNLLTFRCSTSRAESNWLLFNILAFLSDVLGATTAQHAGSSIRSGKLMGYDDHNPRQSKRQRIQDDFSEMVDACVQGAAQARMCALQQMTFYAQQRLLTPNQLLKLVEALSASCGDDNGDLASWAFLALACCASQSSATDSSLSNLWTSIWQLACRSLSNAITCRAASYALYIMLQLRLVSQSTASDLVQAVTNAFDLSGPCIISDASSLLLMSILKLSHQTRPGSSTTLAENIIGWLSRLLTPSHIDDKTLATASAAYDACGVLSLVYTCLGQQQHRSRPTGFNVWGECGRAWILCNAHQELVSYLLLNPLEVNCAHSDLLVEQNISLAGAGVPPRLSCESLLLSHFTSELSRTNEAWKALVQGSNRQPSVDTFAMLCKACSIAVCAVTCPVYRDVRHQSQAQKQAIALLDSLCHFVASSHCDDIKADILLSTFSATFSRCHTEHNAQERHITECEKIICRVLARATARRQHAIESNYDSDAMDLDDEFESQDSRQGLALSNMNELSTDFDVAFSNTTLRCSSALYANIVLAIIDTSDDLQDPSTKVIDYLLKQSETFILSCRGIIAILPRLGIFLTAPDVERLLARLSETKHAFIRNYAYRRSEVARGAVLEILVNQALLWTDRTNESLYKFGLDLYDWCTGNLLSPDVRLSANELNTIAKLLINVCDIDTDYASQESAAPSPVKAIMGLLQRGRITTMFQLAKRISHVFDHFVLSRHAEVFTDLVENLPDDSDWIEGIAVRLLFLSQLAAAWHSLLRHCVYYMFETAGRVKSSMQHTAHCIQALASQLPLKTPQKLFSLFAPQLLFTWFETRQPLKALPFAAFQYRSLGELLTANESEACAQLVARQSADGLDSMAIAIKFLPPDLLRRSFSKCIAYAISQDIGSAKSHEATVERFLTDRLGGKEEEKVLILERLPTIVGYLYLTLRQDDPGDQWLSDQPSYKRAFEALTEIKGYSYSSRALPDPQQPAFGDKRFCERLERLHRRHRLETLWTPSSFTLTARMLFDAIDESLGSMNTCLMIRRIRLLICMAGEVAYQSFALEMLVHSLRPFVNDSECADDTLGILWYLLRHGQDHFRQNLPFVRGAVTLIILQMRRHSTTKHDKTTQDSQHVATVNLMSEFQKWLVSYFSNTIGESKSPEDMILIKALGLIKLPGNAENGTPESSLLLFLLDQWRADDPLCSRIDTQEAIELLSERFNPPASVLDDCLGEDEAAVRYGNSIRQVMESAVLAETFTIWAAQVVGRVYAATGIRCEHKQQSSYPRAHKKIAEGGCIAASQRAIATRLTRSLFSRGRHEASLAEYCLRRLYEIPCSNAEEAIAFDQMLPTSIHDAVRESTYHYAPVLELSQIARSDLDTNSLRLALGHSNGASLADWTTHLAFTMCSWATEAPHVAILAPLFQDMQELALELLPSIIHILLVKEIGGAPAIRTELSTAATALLAETDEAHRPKQQFVLRLLLYLRSQPYPEESTEADRFRWLDVDYVLAAEAGSRCGMPTSALLFAELVAPTMPQSLKKVSVAGSLPQLPAASVSDEILLSIYRNVEDSDSYYSVQQPASLNSVLNRLDHEGDGLRSLMFRSAQMDSHMRTSRQLMEEDAAGMIRSLANLNFNSLAFTLLSNGFGSASCPDEMLSAARTLQQWDVAPSEKQDAESATTFGTLKELSRANNLDRIQKRLQSALIDHIAGGSMSGRTELLSHSWYGALATLTEISEIVGSRGYEQITSRWQNMQTREKWMRMARFEDANLVLSNRHTLFGVLRRNVEVQKLLHIDNKTCHILEAEAWLHASGLAREHSRLQEALSAATTISEMVQEHSALSVKVEAAVKLETASALWDAGEASASVKLLHDILELSDMEKQDIMVGRAGLLAQLGHQLGEARLEKPEEILSRFLKPAVSHLKARKDGAEAGKVFHEFAAFCDNEFQNPGNVENFHRITKLRQGKEDEVEAIKSAIRTSRKAGADTGELERSLHQAQKWVEIDSTEEQRLKSGRQQYVHQSLQNYLLALRASDDHDICVLRFFALWLEHSDDQDANSIALKYLQDVPSWKFVLLMNQLMSRVERETSIFQNALSRLLVRVCADHPHHSAHHLFAAASSPAGSDPAATSRYVAASAIFKELCRDSKRKELVNDRIFRADEAYRSLAENRPTVPRGVNKFHVRDFPQAANVQKLLPKMMLPPITMSMALRPSADYQDVAIVMKYDSRGSIMSGNSSPKLVTCLASDGKYYRQLFKAGDDLRQDAIMEQVFEEVSNMLRNHKATRQRDLKVRTYKVLPLSAKSGIIEFVPNSLPINDYLRPAHKKYYPQDCSDTKARGIIDSAAQSGSTEHRIKEFRKICERIHPVLRHFFFERFHDPDEWFEKRTAYTRTTASISILGHILGLGDRHNSNIMLDEVTGEVVHIDLGVAFEAGRVLKIPELVPFRLTRDIVDGMGIARTEGVFRRCCEFTLDAVREDKDSIMTLLNVLRYDPLYSWTVSPLRAKRMQEAQDTGRSGALNHESSGKKREAEAGEADRALSIVQKKLSKTLSTSAAVNELIQQATDEKHLATLFHGWAAFF